MALEEEITQLSHDRDKMMRHAEQIIKKLTTKIHRTRNA
jgi:hypothetical protein